MSWIKARHPCYMPQWQVGTESLCRQRNSDQLLLYVGNEFYLDDRAGVMSEDLGPPCASNGSQVLNKRLLRVQLMHQLHTVSPAESGEASRLNSATANPETLQHMLRRLLERKSSLSMGSGGSVSSSDLSCLWGNSISSSSAPSF